MSCTNKKESIENQDVRKEWFIFEPLFLKTFFLYDFLNQFMVILRSFK